MPCVRRWTALAESSDRATRDAQTQRLSPGLEEQRRIEDETLTIHADLDGCIGVDEEPGAVHPHSYRDGDGTPA